MARWAAFIKRNANPDAAWLTVDAGNYVDRQGTGGCSNKCQFMVTSYEDLHYDVLNLGKQEVWMGYETLEALMDTTQGTEFVSANLLNRETRKPFAKPYVIRDYGTMRIGVVGLLNEADFPAGTAMLDTVRLQVIPAIEAAQKYIPSLAKKVDAVVLLADLPTQALDTLLKVVPEVDMVISAGALRTGETPTVMGTTHVVGTGSSGYNGHYAMLEFNPAWGDSIGFSQYQDQLTGKYDEKSVWVDRLAAFEAAPKPQPATSVRPASPDPRTAKPVPVQPKSEPTKAKIESEKKG
ncbi:MAG: hypothetical protein ACOZB3_01700 [Calditrichota bacterium]